MDSIGAAGAGRMLPSLSGGHLSLGLRGGIRALMCVDAAAAENRHANDPVRVSEHAFLCVRKARSAQLNMRSCGVGRALGRVSPAL